MFCFISVLSALTPQVAHADDVEIDRRLSQSLAEYDVAIESAEKVVVELLDKSWTGAQQAGDLKAVTRIDAEKNAFLSDGTPPQSLNQRIINRFLRAKSRADSTLVAAYKRAISAHTKANAIPAAEFIQKELDRFVESGRENLNASFENVTNAGSAKPLANRARAYTNRGYTWVRIPKDFPLKKFYPIPGDREKAIIVRVDQPGWLYVAISSEDKNSVNAFVTSGGWLPTGLTFAYSTKSQPTQVFVYRKQVRRGEFTLPPANWSGPLLLSP